MTDIGRSVADEIQKLASDIREEVLGGLQPTGNRRGAEGRLQDRDEHPVDRAEWRPMNAVALPTRCASVNQLSISPAPLSFF